jgi:hypothetical protein
MHRDAGVRHPDLVTHAGTVAAVADRVATAARAGRVVRPSSHAYGKMGLIVPVMLAALQDLLVDGIDQAAASVQDTAARLRTTAQEYEAADRRQTFDKTRPGP